MLVMRVIWVKTVMVVMQVSCVNELRLVKEVMLVSWV